MSSDEQPPIAVDISKWVEQARHDPQRYLERQATEVLLAAVGASAPYGDRLYLKGGILMGLVYHSPRQTADVDFTADFDPTEAGIDELREHLDRELQRAPARLGYPDLVCCVQRIELRPRADHFADANFPALQMNIAFARRGTAAHQRLEEGQCPTILKMEVSFREPVHAVAFIRLGDAAAGVRTYSLVDLIAEKLRALLQQVPRRRNRRQDIYDIDLLLRKLPPSQAEKQDILAALRTKARARAIEPSADSLADPEIKQRAKAEWHTLTLELAELPDFDTAFARVERFYRALPW